MKILIFWVFVFLAADNGLKAASPDNLDSLSGSNGMGSKYNFSNPKVIVEPYGDYLNRLNILVTIAIGVFGLLVGVQIFTNRGLLTDAKTELEKIRSSNTKYEALIKDFESQKTNIISEIRRSNEEQLNTHVNNYRFKAIKNELLAILEEHNPDQKAIFFKLSEIISSPDKNSLLIFVKCLDRFPENKDIIHVCKNGLAAYHRIES